MRRKKALAGVQDALSFARLGAEPRAMPSAVGFSQEKVFEHELGFAGRERSSARWARYPTIDAVGQSLSSNHLIERTALQADEIDLCAFNLSKIPFLM